MFEYGYINENGCLVSKFIEEQVEQYRDDDGNIQRRTITVEMQIPLYLEKGWKPVDPIDEEKLKCKEGYFVRIIPYDEGTKISYRYDMVFDTQRVRTEIQELKDRLTNEDYKIIKCYEANLLGQKLPYDIKQIHEERQNYRDRINELEGLIKT